MCSKVEEVTHNDSALYPHLDVVIQPDHDLCSLQSKNEKVNTLDVVCRLSVWYNARTCCRFLKMTFYDLA